MYVANPSTLSSFVLQTITILVSFLIILNDALQHFFGSAYLLDKTSLSYHLSKNVFLFLSFELWASTVSVDMSACIAFRALRNMSFPPWVRLRFSTVDFSSLIMTFLVDTLLWMWDSWTVGWCITSLCSKLQLWSQTLFFTIPYLLFFWNSNYTYITYLGIDSRFSDIIFHLKKLPFFHFGF